MQREIELFDHTFQDTDVAGAMCKTGLRLELANPEIIMLLGAVAAGQRLSIKSVTDARGRVIERDGRKYMVGYHPASQIYRKDLGEKILEDFARLKQNLSH